jgi:DNA-directed RNA polymerase specialized sigma24 family protein
LELGRVAARRLGVSSDWFDDVASEATLRALRARPGCERVAAWCGAVDALRARTMVHHSSSREPVLFEELDVSSDRWALPAEPEDWRHLLPRCVDGPLLRLLELVLDEGMSKVAAGEAMGVPRWQVERWMRTLRDRVDPDTLR